MKTLILKDISVNICNSSKMIFILLVKLAINPIIYLRLGNVDEAMRFFNRVPAHVLIAHRIQQVAFLNISRGVAERQSVKRLKQCRRQIVDIAQPIAPYAILVDRRGCTILTLSLPGFMNCVTARKALTMQRCEVSTTSGL